MTDLTITDDDADLPPDEDVPREDTGHYCQVCGVPVERNGTRGRWPAKCPQHARTKSGTTRRTKVSAVQAQQAAHVLARYNAMIGTALFAAPKQWRLPETAKLIAKENETFEAEAASALENDPELCAMILKSGMLSGRAALIMAYGGMAGVVVPTAVMEWKGRNGAQD